jgi:hypothetical protein
MTSSTSWTVPDPTRGPGPGTAAQPAGDLPPAPAAADPGTRADVRAGVVTAVALVLLGAPAGLLWAVLAPRVTVLLSGSTPRLVTTDRDVFIAADATFLAVVLGVGLLCGAAAWVLGRRHGLAVVLGLAAGGLLAAYVASRTGALLDATTAQDAVDAGRMGVVELAVRLRAREAMLGWPVGALVGFLVPALLRGEEQPVSSG